MADKKFTIRIPEDLHAQLEQIAKDDLRSLHSQILVILREAAARRRPLMSRMTDEERRQETDRLAREGSIKRMASVRNPSEDNE